MPDPPNHRLFIARTDRLMVVSEDGKLPGEVKGINGSGGTGVDNAAGRGYASLIFFCPGTLWTRSGTPADARGGSDNASPCAFSISTTRGPCHRAVFD